ncbi:Cyn operon transcriptional activator [Variovorax sp. SRS16]|uniref:LysR family transcriptional regulator n=1 Tax=Variovorax sp. SRS16 TaxID=282217 RepID=UPI001318D7A0|nr:LysR family transcriptional regulator [Variovorax sp. SRS16]VTU13981.1 Cyn operon transcriptional activator [Variovorax sp. SRS16]
MQDDAAVASAALQGLTGGSPPLNLTLRLLEVFLVVVERRTMTAAAEQLNLTQAAVSQSITALEQVLRAKLLDRSVRPPVLTLVGQSVCQHALEIVTAAHKLEDQMRYSGSGRLPLLRIGMLDSFASTAGVTVLSQLRELAFEWTIASGFRATGIPALLERRSDVIITSDETPVPPEVEALPICSEPFVLAIPASHHGKVSDVKSLGAKLDFIRYGRDAHMLTRIQSYLESAGMQAPVRYQFDTTDAVVRMVAGGFGWTVMTPLILLKSGVQPHAVRVLPLPGPAMRRTLIVATRRGEGTEIAQQIRATSIATLKSTVVPQLAKLMPHVVKEFRILEKKGPLK